MHPRIGQVGALLVATSALLATSCGGDDAGVSPSESTLRVHLADAPVAPVTKVWVQFTGIEVKPVGANALQFAFSPAKGYDLLTLQGGNSAVLLGDTTVPAGEYEWIRLIVDPANGSNYLIDGSGQHELRVPSGEQSGLKLIRGFTMPAGGRADFTIDFDLAKSILTPPGQAPRYLMKPVLRMVNNIQVGTLAGSFQPATLAAQTACANVAPRVYVYTGTVGAPDDIYNPENSTPDTMSDVDPLVTTTATQDATGRYVWTIAFLPAGSYTVAFTCNADDPLVDEDTIVPDPITFTVHPQTAVVSVGQTTSIVF